MRVHGNMRGVDQRERSQSRGYALNRFDSWRPLQPASPSFLLGLRRECGASYQLAIIKRSASGSLYFVIWET